MSRKNLNGGSSRNSHSTSMAYSAMVPKTNENVNTYASAVTKECNSSSLQSYKNAQTVQKPPSSCLSHIRSYFRNKGFPEESINILCSSWRHSTTKQYQVYFKKWLHFCSEQQINPLQYNELKAIDFLTKLFNNGNGYSSINTARSSLSTILVNDSCVTIGASPLVKRFLKGVYELRPPVVRYEFIWDVNVVFEFLKNFYPLEDISLNVLTYKLIMLLALTTKQRAQTLHAININDIQCYDNFVIIPINKLLKNSCQRKNKCCLHLKTYPDPSLCVVQTLKHYIHRTKFFRGNCKQLFISFQKPYLPVSKDSISRWIKTVMTEAGIDTDIFKAHSTRAASSSAAKRNNVPIDDILKSAGWSNSKTFETFYDKIIL